ncbi:Beta-1,4-galactosyltransferase 4,Beta-1,4-N-acetylgalactosaminyltransferase bre-4,Beta-1,4-galactosyltransferase 5,Beta-N-acetyl-D-glucosaminide beta-1,4-N-acetylglucosaminyl-transferase,Beta-1,4-galactosyltransferase 3,Beta-1,4-galactosyltransferase 6 [Mytilus edulis]|uniref:Beta-1,4-galactosyltransferase n=1 Tax=Mytilus edulis TaxID=6550 RepID=A0A8S3QPG9_MYTED|nr:Beta-1,4-galactosyltransferase 4,Beta-1,4-N-acetylgalactosaminyltransferase bre-4,Beta-1,4-galactosyltransferase 5,Beta-N-acetyl-D-glucosaminide beta-1,4-N-acetylglucosaminyl-transferase,Beta-1,4-galactosyltransferase 3,Beta-1,4-galactosyltransferase 6 [Mytilus edulis]
MRNGHYKPNCRPIQRIAIIVPYRERETQLKIFFLNVVPLLYRQQLEFDIYVVEQVGGRLFNKGALINTGFLQSKIDHSYDCYVIHDVDILPEDDRNYYTCGENPRHLAVLVQQFGYRLHYPEYVGGILALTSTQMENMNGFSNLYNGWGFEDDDFYRRIKNAGYKLERTPDKFAYCGSLDHKAAIKNKDGCEIFMRYGRMWRFDGLESSQYTTLKREKRQLFKWILVDFDANLLKENLKVSVKNIDKSTLPPRYKGYKDSYCAWYLNQKSFSTIKNVHYTEKPNNTNMPLRTFNTSYLEVPRTATKQCLTTML